MQNTTNYKLNKPDVNDNVNINDLNKNMDVIDEALKKIDDFFGSGGVVNGPIRGVEGTTGHRFLEHIGRMNGRNVKIRNSTANFNGYPGWNYIIEDLDNDVNSNGIQYTLGTGVEGDAYKNNILRPWKQGYNSGKNQLGSPNVPWDDLYLVGKNIAPTGYSKLPNDLIIQWGMVHANVAEKQVNYPIIFPNRTLSISTTLDAIIWANVRTLNITPSSFNIALDKVHSNSSVYWMAIGY